MKFLSFFMLLKSFNAVVKKIIPYKKSTMNMIMWWFDLLFLLLTSGLFIWRLYQENGNVWLMIAISSFFGVVVLLVIPYVLYTYRSSRLKPYLLVLFICLSGLLGYNLWRKYIKNPIPSRSFTAHVP